MKTFVENKYGNEYEIKNIPIKFPFNRRKLLKAFILNVNRHNIPFR